MFDKMRRRIAARRAKKQRYLDAYAKWKRPGATGPEPEEKQRL